MAYEQDSTDMEEILPQLPLPPPRRKVNNIWTVAITDDMLEGVLKDMNGIDVKEDDGKMHKFDRGPESYSIEKSVLKKFHRDRKRKLEQDSQTHTLDDEEFSDSSVTSGGLSDNSLALLGRRKPKISRKRKIKRKKRIYEEGELSSDEEDDIAFAARICEGLAENNSKLMRKVVEAVGQKMAHFIYLKVLKIEKYGGLLIKDGSRRRTPGGVFFTIIQKHPKTAGISTLREILQNQKKSCKKRKIVD